MSSRRRAAPRPSESPEGTRRRARRDRRGCRPEPPASPRPQSSAAPASAAVRRPDSPSDRARSAPSGRARG